MKNTSKGSFDDKLEDNKVDDEMADAERAKIDEKVAEENQRVLEHEKGGVIGNPAEQHERSIEEPVNPNQPDLSDRPTNDPSVYPSDPHKGLTPNPLPAAPQVEPLPNPAVHEDEDKKVDVEEILARLLHIGNIAHHAGNQFDAKTIGHALRDLAHLMHRMISEK